MAGTSATSTRFELRIPNNLLAYLKRDADAVGQSIAQVLLAPHIVAMEQASRPAEATKAASVAAVKSGKRTEGRLTTPQTAKKTGTKAEIDTKRHHTAGPVLKSAVPSNLSGEARAVPKGKK